MAIALVGAAGAVSQSASGAAVTPAWGTGANRTANNLLICCVTVAGSVTLPATPAGWTLDANRAGTLCAALLFIKVATGADAAPTIPAVTGAVISAQLYEFSGTAAVSPHDRGSTAAGTATPIIATNSAADIQAGSLLMQVGGARNSTARTNTLTHTPNNGAGSTSSNNNAVSTQNHYNYAYGLTTSNAAADSDSMAFGTAQLSGAVLAISSFKPALAPIQMTLTPVTDTDTPQVLNADKAITLTPLSATTSPQTQAPVKRAALAPVTLITSLPSLSLPHRVTLTPILDIDGPQTLRAAKGLTLFAIASTTSPQGLASTKHRSLVTLTDNGQLQALRASKQRSLLPIVEQDLVQALLARKPIHIVLQTVAIDNQAVPLNTPGTIRMTLTPVTISLTDPNLTISKHAAITPIQPSEEIHGIAACKETILTPVTVMDLQLPPAIAKLVQTGVLAETDFLPAIDFYMRPSGTYVTLTPVYDAFDAQSLGYYIVPPESTDLSIPGASEFLRYDFPPSQPCEYCLKVNAYDANPDNKFREAIGVYAGLRVCREHAIYLQLASGQPLPTVDPFRLHRRPLT